ncbi:MAG: hypothetical protein RIC55_23320 [Pirellulaceae bacterium]
MRIVEAADVDPDFSPICPHCNQPLEEVVRLEDQKGWFQGHLGYCYACPKCRKVLGFADYHT